MRRNAALRLRFSLLVYAYVNSRRKIRARLALLASAHFEKSKENNYDYG